MYSKKRVVYKLHTGRFINRTPGEFINRGLLIKFKGLLCGNPTERAKSLKYQISGRNAVYKSNTGTVTVCRKQGASGQEKIQYIKYLHCQLKVPKRGQFHAAIRVTTKRCDPCDQGALGRRTASRRETFAMRNR